MGFTHSAGFWFIYGTLRRKSDCKNQCVNSSDANLKSHVHVSVYGWEITHLPVGHRGFASSNGLVQGRTCFHIFRLKRFFISFPGLYSAVSQTYRNVHRSSVKHHFWKY